MKKIKGVIFDLDGTLADTLPLCVQAFRQSIEPLTSTPLTDAEIIATFGPSEEGTIMALAPQHYEQGVVSYLQYYETLHDMCPAPFEDIRELLFFLKDQGIRVAMVTGKGPHSTTMSLKKFGLTDVFEIVETGSPLGPRKHQGIQAVLTQWAPVRKDEVIYVGDMAGDVTACRAAGVAIAGAAWAPAGDAHGLKDSHPDELFYSVRDFKDWLTPLIA